MVKDFRRSETFGTAVASHLCEMSLDDANAWFTRIRQAEILGRVKRHVDEVAQKRVPLADAVALLAETSAVRAAERELGSTGESDADRLGTLYEGLATNWEVLEEALRWAERIRCIVGAPLSPRAARAILATTGSYTEFASRIRNLEKQESLLLAAFTDDRQNELEADLAANFEDALGLLEDMSGTISDIETWGLFATSRTALDEAGLEAVTTFCADRRLDHRFVAPVVERAILESWADRVIASDKRRLSPGQSVERDALVETFQQLDVALVADAAAAAVNACAARRPTSTAGTAGIIQKEAQKQKKHMPIRELLTRAGTVAQQLKPCFMMSPLSVSQYLPPTLGFDAVVFDEASQVLPSDAINCVYRGRQLIVAGDQKQLPPSSFFMRMGADDEDVYDEDAPEDFESVLDLCKAAGGFRSLPLRWHYRSHHEQLITYSNYRFYDGDLHTFPSAAQDAPDLGLEVFKVDGMYRRGAQRDNPIEAATVVDRVLFHLQNPGLLTRWAIGAGHSGVAD